MEYVVVLDGGRPWGVRIHSAAASDTHVDDYSQAIQRQQQQQRVTVAKVRLHHHHHHHHQGLLYSAFHPSGVGKWVPVIAGKAKAGMAHSDCGWTRGCAGKTVKSLENTCHTWALLQWWFTTKRRYIKCMHLYFYLSSSSFLIISVITRQSATVRFRWRQ